MPAFALQQQSLLVTTETVSQPKYLLSGSSQKTFANPCPKNTSLVYPGSRDPRKAQTWKSRTTPACPAPPPNLHPRLRFRPRWRECGPGLWTVEKSVCWGSVGWRLGTTSWGACATSAGCVPLGLSQKAPSGCWAIGTKQKTQKPRNNSRTLEPEKSPFLSSVPAAPSANQG